MNINQRNKVFLKWLKDNKHMTGKDSQLILQN